MLYLLRSAPALLKTECHPIKNKKKKREKLAYFKQPINILYFAKGSLRRHKTLKMLPRLWNQWFNKLKRKLSTNKHPSQFWVKEDQVLVYNTVLCFRNMLLSFPGFPPCTHLSSSVAKEPAYTRDQISPPYTWCGRCVPSAYSFPPSPLEFGAGKQTLVLFLTIFSHFVSR